MEKHIIVSIFLWSLCILMCLTIVFSMVSTVTYVEDTTLSDTDENNEHTILDSEYIGFEMDDEYHMDIQINTEKMNILFSNLNPNDEPSNIKLESDKIDTNMSSTAMVGLCISGLNSSKSPTKIDFDEDDNMNVSIDSDKELDKPVHNTLTVQEIVDNCSDN